MDLEFGCVKSETRVLSQLVGVDDRFRGFIITRLWRIFL